MWLEESGSPFETWPPIGCGMSRHRRAQRLPSIVIVACARGNEQDARGDSEADKRIKQVRNIELTLTRQTSARYIRDSTETHTNTHTRTHTQLLHARATHSSRTHIWLHTWSIVGEHSVFQCKFFSPLWPMCKYEQHGSVSCFSSSLASTKADR